MIAGPWRILGIVATFAGSSAMAQTVIDGDTLNYKGTVVYLWGIDAPDKGHVCAGGWDAGKAAADHLRSLIGNKPPNCEPKASPAPGGPFALQGRRPRPRRRDGVGRHGLGDAEHRRLYSVQASNAMYAIRGVYAHPCVTAWEWRAGIRTRQ